VFGSTFFHYFQLLQRYYAGCVPCTAGEQRKSAGGGEGGGRSHTDFATVDVSVCANF
jgi:hypothetical protein